MAYLSRIFIYPVKSLEAISLETVKVLPTGALSDDRRFAILDQFGNYVNSKRNARMHLIRSTFDPGTQKLTIASAEFPNDRQTFHVDNDRQALEQWLSRFFEMPVTFQENTALGFPDDTESPGPTVISTATLTEVARWFDLTLDQARARFRANLEIDGVPPFWEDHLFAQRGTTVQFAIGNVQFDGINPCQRCIVPARDQATGAGIPDFARRFVELRRKHFPEWAESTRFNHYYRLAVNTKLSATQSSGALAVGQPLKILGITGVPEIVSTPPSAPSRFTGKLRVLRKQINTPTVTTFRLGPLSNDTLPFKFLSGQFLNIEVPIDGFVHRRCYTIASSPTRTNYCEITVKREEDGIVSRFLHDHFEEGLEIDVSGPGGRFTFQPDEADALLLVAAGVGITPIMSTLRYLTETLWRGEVNVVYSARTESDIIFREELRSIEAVFANVNVHITLTGTREESWRGRRGRIDHEMLCNAMSSEKNVRVHICGPIEMAESVRRLLTDIGVPSSQIRSEAFGGKLTAAITPNQDDTKPLVGVATFTESGLVEPIRRDCTILDLASKAGLVLDRGCMEGICGRCKVRLLSGSVTMNVEDALTDSDRTAGVVLACQAKPQGNVAIDL